MAALACDLCGGKLVMGAGGVATCESCGMEYTPERMREKIKENNGTIRAEVPAAPVDNSPVIDNFLSMAKTALDANNNAEAESYANKVIEAQPRHAEAWLIKGKAAGWQTTGRKNRYPESILAWINAYEFTPEEEKAAISKEITTEAENIGHAIVKMECNSFERLQTEENTKDVTNAVSMVEKQLDILKDKTGIEVYTDEFKTILARAVNTAAVNGSNDADNDFGTERSGKTKYKWERFTGSQDRCLTLLDKAYDLSSDDNLCHTISKNYIQIATTVRDSCSYKYQSGGYYGQDYSFTAKAKEIRTDTIKEWEKKRDKHDPAKRKSNSKKALDLYQSSLADKEKKAAIAKYWEEHADEKARLEQERKELDNQSAQFRTALINNADEAASKKLNAEIAETRTRMSSLGLFKGKEKKALAAKIEELTTQKNHHDSLWNAEKKRLDGEQQKIADRKKAIEEEFTKERGRVKAAPAKLLELFPAGDAVVTGQDLLQYFRDVLPSGTAVREKDGEAIVNYSKLLILKGRAMMAALNALLGKDEDVDLSYEDDPDKFKCYRINFTAGKKDTDTSFNFTAKSTEGPISSRVYFELEEGKNPQDVCNFLKIVMGTITGFCPNIDADALETKIAEAAYGLVSKTEFKANGIVCEITGGTKNDLKVALQPEK